MNQKNETLWKIFRDQGITQTVKYLLIEENND